MSERPLRIGLLANTAGFFALEKPAGVVATRDASGGARDTLLDVLRQELEKGKKQLKDKRIAEAHAVSFPSPEISGIFLCAKTEEAKRLLKSTMGAYGFAFTHRFLTYGRRPSDEFVCELPLVHPAKSSRMRVSHATGKKASTRFRKIRELAGGFALWEAESRYNRRHQVRLHAAESGLPALGDQLYAGSGPVYLSSLKRAYRAKGREQPLYGFPCVHLAKLEFTDPESGEPVTIEAPLPGRFAALIARIERYG